MNGDATTQQILQYGALGGVMKSGMINFSKLIGITTSSIYIQVSLLFVGSTFGAAILITLALSQKAMQQSVYFDASLQHVRWTDDRETAPTELVIAAAAAGAPLLAGTLMMEASGTVLSAFATLEHFR